MEGRDWKEMERRGGGGRDVSEEGREVGVRVRGEDGR